jgi:hypothetical protein
MKITHDYAARIDYDLWMDCLKVKELDGGTTSINALLNEGLKMVRDRKMQCFFLPARDQRFFVLRIGWKDLPAKIICQLNGYI